MNSVNRTPRVLLAFHGLFVVFMLLPLVVVALVSFTDKGYIAMPFDGASWRWYRAILDAPDFIDAFWRSVALGAAAATLATLLAVPAGMAIAWHRFAGREALLGLLLSPLMVPHVVLGIAAAFPDPSWRLQHLVGADRGPHRAGAAVRAQTGGGRGHRF